MERRQIVGIVGAGQVGMAAAHAIFIQKTVRQMILVDLDTKRTEGEAMDLMHAQAYVGRCQVHSGGFEDLKGAQMIVISAGVGQKPGETRLDLLNRNAKIFKEIGAQLDRYAPDAILLIATNPVDILTYVMQEVSQRPSHRIVGTGTMLDTTRFRTLLSEHYGVDPRSVHALILGEHGDSEVPIWSSANIAGTRIVGNSILGKPYRAQEMESLFQSVRTAANEIISRKGYTNWAIGLVIAHLWRTIQNDQNSILPVSVRCGAEEEKQLGISQVCLSLPTSVGLQGVNGRVLPEMNDREIELLRQSAEILKKTLNALQYSG